MITDSATRTAYDTKLRTNFIFRLTWVLTKNTAIMHIVKYEIPVATAAPIAEKYGIRIALENQIYPVDMDFYLKEIPGLCVNLDFAHAIASGYDVVSMIEKYADKLAGLHVSDSYGRKEDYHIMPKKGIVNWDMAIKSIEHSCYDGDLHLEIVHERSTELSENNEKAKQLLAKVFSFKKKDKEVA